MFIFYESVLKTGTDSWHLACAGVTFSLNAFLMDSLTTRTCVFRCEIEIRSDVSLLDRRMNIQTHGVPGEPNILADSKSMLIFAFARSDAKKLRKRSA